MKLQFTLVQKGLGLVLALLSMVLILTAVLYNVTAEMERVALEVSRARNVRAQVNEYVKQLYDAIKTVRFKPEVNGDQFDRSKRIQHGIDLLDSLTQSVANDQNKLRIVNQLKHRLIVENEILAKARSAQLAGNIEEVERLAVCSSENMKYLADGEILAICDEGTAVENVSHLVADFRDRIGTILCAAAASSIASTLVLVLLVNGGVVGRLGVVARNASLLEQGKPLLPILGGSDEIARLDQRFHLMADALDESRQRERAIIDSSVDVICSLTRSGLLKDVSPSSAVMLGYTTGELENRDYAKLIAPDSLVRTIAAVDAIMIGDAAVFETQLLAKDGRVRDVLWSGQWSQQEDSMFVVLHDVSVQKQARRMKQQIVGMVTHDLRTPLTAIAHIHEMLEDGLLGELGSEALSAVRQADRAGRKMVQIINDLLDLEKIEAGMLELQKSLASVNHVVHGCRDALSNSAKERSIALQSRDADATSYMDELRISQALLKVIEYFIDASNPDDTVMIDALESSDRVDIRVENKTLVLSGEEHETIFQPFGAALYRQPTIDLVGSGLGLALSRAVLNLHGGRIEIIDIEEGTMFTLSVPRTSNGRAIS